MSAHDPTGTLRLHLSRDERLFLNGTVVSLDRRATLSLHARASFLRGRNVMQADEATTPLRGLYFTVQRMLLAPDDAASAALEAGSRSEALLAAVATPALVEGLVDAREALREGRPFAAMRGIKALFPIEDRMLGRSEERAA